MTPMRIWSLSQDATEKRHVWQGAEKVRQHKKTVVWFVWFVWFFG
jgi:hypothetical protein